MIPLYYKHADTHTHTDTHTWSQTETWIMAACFSRFPFPCRAAKALWGTHDSECLNFRCLNHSGAKIMAFQCEGQMWEMLFKAPEFRRSAWSCVDGGQPLPIYLQGPCSVSIFNLTRCRTSYFQALDLRVEASQAPSALSLIPKAPASSVLCFALWVIITHGQRLRVIGSSQEHLSQNHQGHCTHRART